MIETMERLYGKVLNKLEESTRGKIRKDQTGFMAGRYCVDHFYSLQQLVDKKKVKNRSIHIAYDSIPKSIL